MARFTANQTGNISTAAGGEINSFMKIKTGQEYEVTDHIWNNIKNYDCVTEIEEGGE